MKLSEFRLAVAQEFGAAYGAVVVGDVVLPSLGGRTADEALAGGIAPNEVWLALCAEMDVPVDRRHGATLRDPGELRRRS